VQQAGCTVLRGQGSGNARSLVDFIEKATWTLVGVVVVLSVVSAAFIPKNETIKNSELRYEQTTSGSGFEGEE
jgi:preprotein translocase subunit SecG